MYLSPPAFKCLLCPQQVVSPGSTEDGWALPVSTFPLPDGTPVLRVRLTPDPCVSPD